MGVETQSTAAFVERVTRLLAQPAPATPVSAGGDLYPRGRPPGLLIFVGAPDPGRLGCVRAQLPGTSFLFWLYPPDGNGAQARLEAARSDGERTLFCPLSEADGLVEKVQVICSVVPHREVRLVVDTGYGQQHAAQIGSIQQAIRTALDNREQTRNRGLIRLRSSLHNLPSMVENRGLELGRVPAGTAAIVCGAGPSLASQFDVLRRTASKAVLIAVGHAAPSLARAGILPHIVVEVDAHASANWTRAPAFGGVLVACTEVAPEVVRCFSKALWCYGSSPPFNEAARRWGLRLTPLNLAKTVSTCAVDLAVRLGCTRIALVGQDFCLTRSGTSHVDGARWDNGDPVVEVPANEGGTVPANASLTVVREAIEGYLAYLQRNAAEHGARVHVHNCTLGGAVIRGTARSTLERFAQELEPLRAPLELVREGAPNGGPSHRTLGTAASQICAYEAVVARIAACCGLMRRELAGRPVDMARVAALQGELAALVKAEEQGRGFKESSMLIHPLIEHADNILAETPWLRASESDPEAQARFLEHRFGAIRDACADLLADLDAARTQLAHGDAPSPGLPAAPARGPLVFDAFRRQAVRLLRRRNPELAGLLARRRLGSASARFDMRWMNQCLPHVAVRGEAGGKVPLSSLVSMYEQGRARVEAFVRGVSYRPERDAVVFVAPGNWVHVVEFAGRFPQGHVLVAEPWIELLSELVDRGCFLHRLPETALVVGAHPGSRHWRRLYRAWVARQRAAGRRVLFFPHPCAGDLPEVGALAAELEKLA